MKARSRLKSKPPKLGVPKAEGYRAQAAKRLQSPEYQPDEPKPKDEEEEEGEDGGWAVYDLPGQE